MKLKPVIFALGLVVSGSALAADASDASMGDRGAADLQSLINQNQFGGYDAVTDWANQLKFGVRLDVDWVYSTRKDDVFSAEKRNQTNIQLTHGAFYVDAPINNDWVTAHVELNYDHENTVDSDGVGNLERNAIEIEEAYIQIANFESQPWYVKAGRQYLNFGRYKRYNEMGDIASLAQKLSEIKADAATVGYLGSNGFYGSGSVYRGLTKSRAGVATSKRNVNAFVLDAGYSSDGYTDAQAAFGYRLGASYISNLGDVNTLVNDANFPENNGETTRKANPGYALYGDMKYNAWDANVRYVATTSDFDQNNLAFNGQGAEPWAFTIEGGYNFNTWERNSRVSIGYQATGDSAALNTNNVNVMPKERVILGYDLALFENTSLGVAYLHDTDYDTDKGGTDATHTRGAVRLSVEL